MNTVKLHSFIFLLFLLFTHRFENKPDCAKVRNGKFYYYTRQTREKVYVERKNTVQVESGEGFSLKCKITWKDDCTYMMYSIGDEFSMPPVTVNITHVNDRFYISDGVMKMDGKTIKLRDTLYFTR